MNDGGWLALTSRILYHPFPPVIGDTGTRSFVFVSTPCLCASSDPAAAGERVVELNIFENVCVGGIESAMVRSA